MSTIKIGTKTVQTGDSGYQPQGVNTPTQQQQNVYQQAAQSMQQAGIGSVSGRPITSPTTQEQYETASGTGDQGVITETSPSQRQLEIIQANRPQPKPTTGIDTVLKNVFGLGTGEGFQLPPIGFSGILQSLNANNKFFDKLIDGNVEPKDRVTLVGLLKANANNPNVFDEALKQYADRNDLDTAQITDLRKSFDSEVAGLKRREEDFEKLVEQYESGRPKGFKDGVLSLTGQFDRESGITREELMNQLGPDGEAYLKATNPQLYYSFTSPQTSQGIEELAGQAMSTGKTEEDRQYNARIMEARALAADKRSRENANMAGSSPAFAPPTQPGTPPTTPPGTQPPTTPPPGATPVPAPPSRTPTPFDYSQFPQFDYKMGGLGTTPQFGDFNETLNRFFRFQ